MNPVAKKGGKGFFNSGRAGAANPCSPCKVPQKTGKVTQMRTAEQVINVARNTIHSTVSRMSPVSSIGNEYSHSQLDHLAGCVTVDTLGLELPDVESTTLGNSFARLDDESRAIPGSMWTKRDLRSLTGKQSLRIRQVEATKRLSIEGSNAMLHQGHNVVSSGDVTMAAFSMVRAANREHKLGLPVWVGHKLAHGGLVEVTRLDVALLLKVPDGVSKSALINALALAGIQAGINTSLYVGETVYYDQHSQVEAQKIYDKEVEVNRARKGGLPDVEGKEQLVTLIRETVRLEAVFRKKRLLNIAAKCGGLPHPCLFSKKLLAQMVLELLGKYVRDGQVWRRLGTKELLAIPLPYRSTVAHWQNHMNLIDMAKSERVLQEQKAYLWRNHKINLNAPPPGDVIVPMQLSEILSPENFLPVPAEIRRNPNLFFEEDMEAMRTDLRRKVGGGIGSVIIDPYGPLD